MRRYRQSWDRFFQFRRTGELPPLAREAALQLNVDRMLLEGYRRVDEWRVIEREIRIAMNRPTSTASRLTPAIMRTPSA